MEANALEEHDADLQTQRILLAASNHDLEALEALLRICSASIQDPETGFTPLHAAIAACEPSTPTSQSVSNGTNVNGETLQEVDNRERIEQPNFLERAAQTVKLLLQNGAIWNDIDANDETPGCVARRLGLKELYEIMVDAGVRAEILLSRLDEYQTLRDTEDEEEDEKDGEEAEGDFQKIIGHGSPSEPEPPPPENNLQEPVSNPSPTQPSLSNATYLSSRLSIHPTRILDSSRNGVMMSWETPLMQRTAALLAPTPGLRILNIGHGMGIIDTFFQQTSPVAHHIIEAHPAILTHMRTAEPWASAPSVTIHEGRWQDVVPRLIEQGTLFDTIYFDTFAEDYKALRDFFDEFVIGLLDEEGRWGFFNGLGADRQVCYDVYGKVVEMDLFEAGFKTEWDSVVVPAMMEEVGEWEGVKRRYWALTEYRLPVCRFLS